MTSNRIDHIDFLKCFAIYTVILGHLSQYLTKGMFWNNPLWEFIYSFHMPLFMIMSGYFFNRSMNLFIIAFLKKNFIQLIVPSITGALLSSIFNTTSIIKHPLILADNLINSLWFLKCLFLCSIIAYFSYRIFSNICIRILIPVITLCLLPFNLFYIKFLLLMFFIGNILNLYKDRISRNRKQIFIISLLLFVILLIRWKGIYTIYFTPFDVIDWHSFTINNYQLLIGLYRWGIGIAGSLTFFMGAPWIWKYIKKSRFSNLILNIGKSTLGIYVIQYIILEKNAYVYLIKLEEWQLNLIDPIFSGIFLCICYILVILFRKNKITKLFVLGEKRQNIQKRI